MAKIHRIKLRDGSIRDLADYLLNAITGASAGQAVVASSVDANGKPTALSTATIPSGSSTNPSMDGTASAGSGTTWARADHVHPSDTSRLAASLKGAYNGVAELDANGKVPTSQLPSYVDDVLEYSSQSAFPATGETGKIYVALDTNLTYRWGGSEYTEISPSLALGETSSTAYRGDRGKTAYDHSQLTSGNPHNVSKTDVGLGNVDNTSDATKKTSFTGTIADGNTGFVTGDAVYDALAVKAPIANPTFTGVVRTPSTNQLLTGTSVRASYAGASGETPRYIPGKWAFEAGADPVDGAMYTIKIPSANTAAGAFMSVNGTDDEDYHPIVSSGATRLQTQFGVNTTITVIYEASSTATIYALDPADNNTTTYTGVFRVINYYDANTNTLMRTYASSSTNELPIVGSATSTSMAVPTHTSSYKDSYGGIPATVANRPVIKLSTGVLRSPAGLETGTAGSKLGNVVFNNASNSHKTTVNSGTPTSDVTITMPTSTGTLATTAFVQEAIEDAIIDAIGGSY